MMNEFNKFFTNTANVVKTFFGVGVQTVPAEFRALQIAGTSALSIYDGNAPSQLKVKIGQIDDNLFINYPQLIVEKGVSFLFGKELSISVGDETDNAGEIFLDEIWNKEQRQLDLIDLATDGAIFGTAFLKIRIAANGKPVVIIPDPNNFFVETNPNDYREVWKYICQYQRKNGNEKIWYREETSLEKGKWIIREFESKTGERWTQIGTEIVWKYSFAPVFACKNLPKSKSFYGKSDLHKSVLELCKYLSRVDSLIGKIIRVHASPKPVATGLQKRDLEIGTEDILFLGQNAGATLQLLEMQGDLLGAMAFRKQLREALAEISKVPEVATGKVENIGQLSGIALQILYGPLIEQTLIKQRLYGLMLKNVVQALLEIGGKGNQTIQLHWSNPLPTNAKEDAEVGILWDQLGISQDTIQKRLGFDAAHEKSIKEQETANFGNALGNAFNAGA
jgi:Phage portal protein, SPP1 Gp6-like